MRAVLGFIIAALPSIICMERGLAQGSNPEVLAQYRYIIHQNGIDSCSIDIDGVTAQQGIRSFDPLMKTFYSEPASLPLFLIDFSEKMLNIRAGCVENTQYAFRLMGAPAGGIGPPLAGTGSGLLPCINEDELAGKIDALINGQVILEDLRENETWCSMSFRSRNLVIFLIGAMENTDHLYNEYSMSVCSGWDGNPASNRETMKWLMKPVLEKELTDFSVIAAYEHADVRILSFASRTLMEYLRTAMIMIRECSDDMNLKQLVFNSKFGRIAMLGAEDDTISGSYALVVDLGGDDVYMGGVASSSDIPGSCSILLDRQGNDTYLSAKGMSVCHASLGAAVLIDLEGNDRYMVETSGLGSSLFGFSLLLDQEGNDIYRSKAMFSLGSSTGGVAMVCDGRGDDFYETGSYSQGFAGPNGVAVLLDSEGNDQYGSSENDNTSFLQGASKGRWAEATDGHSLGGGWAFLIDGGGDDHYYSGSYGQGAAYYLGGGFLFDRGGDDTYNAISHSQAYGVHYSVGCLVETNGDDRYNTYSDTLRITQIIASGRDHSAGILIDFNGNDEYCFGNRSVGISDMEGVGVFLDMKGSDTFRHFRNTIYAGSGTRGMSFKGGPMMDRFTISKLKTKAVSVFLDVEQE